MSENRKHAWISNTAFTRMTGLVKVCMDCGLGLEKGERLISSERICPGTRHFADQGTPFHPKLGPIKERA